jgi:hypothetical protein
MGVMGNVLLPMTPVVARRAPSRAGEGDVRGPPDTSKLSPLPLGEGAGVMAWLKHTSKENYYLENQPSP